VTRGRRRKSEKEGRKDGRREEENHPEENRKWRKWKERGIDWVRSWLEKTTIKQIESIVLTLFFGSW
jgi:hypothetical protein